MRLLAAVLMLALSACTAGPNGRDRYARLLTPTANPSEVVATELAFARAAQEDGQWTAFREYATEDAVMFVPQPVNAHDWLKQQSNPPEAVRWQPHELWSSCDGSLAVTKGAWQRPDGTTGYFTTIWQRQRSGRYEWVLDQGDVLTQPLVEPDFIRTQIADCAGERPAGQPQAGPQGSGNGASVDRTLDYSWTVNADGSRSLSVRLLKGGAMSEVLLSRVSAPTS